MQIFFGNPSLLLFSVISLFAAIFPVIFGETDEPEVLALNENEDDGYLLDTSNEAPGGRKEIRVLIYNSPPQMNLYEDDCHQHMPLFQKKLRCRYPGYCIELLNLLKWDFAKKDYHVKAIVRENVTGAAVVIGRLDNNKTWTGVLGALYRGEADTLCELFHKSEVKKRWFNFSRPVYMMRTFMAVRGKVLRPDKVWTLFDAFEPTTWLTIVVFFFAQTAVLVGIARTEFAMGRRKEYTHGDTFWRMVKYQLQQPANVHFHSLAGRMALIPFGILQACVIVALYQAFVVMSLIDPPEIRPFRNLDELAELLYQRRYTLVSFSNSTWFYELVQKSEEYPYTKIRRALDINPVVMVDNVSMMLKMVDQNKRYVAITQDDGVTNYVGHQHCNIMLIGEGMPQILGRFIFQQGSKLVPLFNVAIERNRPYEKRIRWLYNEHYVELKRRKQCKEEFVAIGITPFLGLAAIGFAGLILAMLCFIAELFVRAWHHEPATSDCGGDGGQGEGASEEDPPLQFNVGVRLRDAIAAAAGNEDAGNGEKNDRK